MQRSSLVVTPRANLRIRKSLGALASGVTTSDDRCIA
jgi:hypothetical protein